MGLVTVTLERVSLKAKSGAGRKGKRMGQVISSSGKCITAGRTAGLDATLMLNVHFQDNQDTVLFSLSF